MIMLFAIQLNMLIKTKHSQDLKRFQYELKMKRLPLY
jgi:hypothetical protein